MTAVPMERDTPAELFDVDAEQRILGAILYDDRTFWTVEPLLSADDFFDPMHRRLFEEIGGRKAKNQNVSLFTMKGFVLADEGMKDVGGLQYLSSIAATRASGHLLVEYARAVRKLAQRRAVVAMAERLLEEAHATDRDDIAGLCDMAGEALYDIGHGIDANEGPQDIEVLVTRAAQAAETARNNPEAAVISTGLAPMDRALGGLMPAKMTVLGAPSSAGKTGLAQQIAYAVARQQIPRADGSKRTRQVLFHSMEMPNEEMGTRYLATESRVPGNRVESGRFSDVEWDRIAKAPGAHHGVGLSIDDSSSLSVAQIRARAIAHRRRKGALDLIVIDHLGYVTATDRGAKEHERLDQICKDIKRLANELNVAILLISHVNRDFKDRKNKRPVLTDLYGASSIEKTADHVWFLYREEYFLDAEKPDATDFDAFSKWSARMEKAKGKAEVFAAKRRGGPKDSAALKFDGPLILFSDPDDNLPPAPPDLLALTGR